MKNRDPYMLCKEAREKYTKHQFMLDSIYYANGTTLIYILLAYGIYNLIIYLGGNELIQAFFYPLAISFFLIFLILTSVYLFNYTSIWIRLALSICWTLLILCIGNFIQECLETAFPPDNLLNVFIPLLITLGFTIIFVRIWLLLKQQQEDAVADIHYTYMEQHYPELITGSSGGGKRKHMERIHDQITDLSGNYSHHENVETIPYFELPVIDTKSFLYKVHDAIKEKGEGRT